MLERLRTGERFGLYAGLMALLALLCAAAVWSAARTGAWLTDEGDWQYLGGDYRIGTIDYTVTVNDQTLISPGSGEALKLAVPLTGGVSMFDPTVATAERRVREFNEGATLARVRIINRSDSMVEVYATFSLEDQTAAALRVLPLPTDLDAASALRLDYRQYVMDTLGLSGTGHDDGTYTDESGSQALDALDAAYTAYHADGPMALDAGIIPGTTDAGSADADVVLSGDRYCYYKDVFLLLWSEYAPGDYDGGVTPSSSPRQGRFSAVFSVGQLD